MSHQVRSEYAAEKAVKQLRLYRFVVYKFVQN